MSNKKHNLKTRLMALTLISSILGGSIGLNSQASAREQSPEMKLVLHSAAISGKKLNKEQIRAELNQALIAYNESAPAEGRDARLMQALVDSRIMSEERAAEFRSDVERAMAEELSRNPGAEPKQAIGSTVASAIGKIQGAQYSCSTAILVGVGAAAGMVFSIQKYKDMTKDDYYYSDRNVTIEQRNPDAVWPMLAAIGFGAVLWFDLIGAFGVCD